MSEFSVHEQGKLLFVVSPKHCTGTRFSNAAMSGIKKDERVGNRTNPYFFQA